jgi:predicted DNA-binding protein
MNRSKKQFSTMIGIRLTEQDREDLERLCSALGVTKSEFVRKRIENLNNTIMSNNNLFNIQKAPATDAWGRKIAGEKGKQAKANQSFKEQMNHEFNNQLMEKLGNVSATEGENPFSTPEGVLDQLKKRQ